MRVAGVLPGGSIPVGGSETAIPRAGSLVAHDSVSTDGSRLLFLASLGGPNQQLLMRKDHTSTTWVSESEGSAPVAEPEGVQYQWATPDLSRVFFTTTSQLTDEDPGGAGEALYVYNDSTDPENDADNLEFLYRNVLVTVNGISEDGSSSFFYSQDSVDKGTLFHWDEQGVDEVTHVHSPGGEGPVENQLDLSVPRLVHGVNSGTRVSADGSTITFLSKEELTESDLGVSDPSNGALFPALYVYDTDTDKLVCASCPPSGEATSGPTWIYPGAPEDGSAAFAFGRNTFLTPDGRLLFFSSPDPLVPEDTNGRYDAYEYEVETGEAHLLSTGHSPSDSWFASASPSGDDAIIVTFEQLSGHDVDNAKDMYDARVGGGLPEPSPAPARCEGDACQPPALGLNDPTPSSEAFTGAGNPKKAKAKKKHARHKRQHAKQTKRKHQTKRKQHRANANRRTSK